eukprot:1736735-Pyramimonas_sp.AAC.1
MRACVRAWCVCVCVCVRPQPGSRPRAGPLFGVSRTQRGARRKRPLPRARAARPLRPPPGPRWCPA